MACKVEGCNQPIYHYNPLVTSLLNFHGMVAKFGDELPADGKAAEVLKRVAIAVVSPFAYLALAFVAMAGIILNGIWEKRHALQIGEKNQQPPSLSGKISEQEEIELSGTTKGGLEKGCQIPEGAFGKEDWEKAFPVRIDEVPPLPENIHEILELDDPVEPGKKLKETCMLFLRPQKVILHEEGKGKELPLSFDGVEELAEKATNPDLRTKYHTFNGLRSKLNQMPVREAGWVLMRKELIPGSIGREFKSQKKLLKGGFVVPTLMDAVLLNILTYASKGKRLYGADLVGCGPWMWTYTRCQEKYKGYETVVGRFFPSSLCVSYFSTKPNCYTGLGGVWKFS